MLIIDTVSTCFGHLYAHLQEKDTCYCMWSVFYGSAGCGSLRYCGAMLRVWSLWRLLWVEQQPSQWSHPQHSTTVPQTATSSTTIKYTPHEVTSVFLLTMGIKMPETCWDSVNNQHPLLTINHLYCCILLVFFPHDLEWGIASPILNLGTRGRWLVNFTFSQISSRDAPPPPPLIFLLVFHDA